MKVEQQQPRSMTRGNGKTTTLPRSLPATMSQTQWQLQLRKVVDFLSQLPSFLSSSFHNNKQALYSIAFILLAWITVKLMLAVLNTINDIPLLAPTFQLVGIGYVTWFILRYLLQAGTRQELVNTIHDLR
jgi:hypothetical protein